MEYVCFKISSIKFVKNGEKMLKNRLGHLLNIKNLLKVNCQITL